MNKKIFVMIINVIALTLWQTSFAQDDHEGCNHEIEEETKVEKDEHAGHDHQDIKDEHDDHEKDVDGNDGNAHSEHDDHGLEVKISNETVKIIGLSIGKAEKETLSKTVRLSGEVDFNQDRLVHLVPRFPGIAKKINKRLGDQVKANETVAVIESNESLSLFDVKSLISGTVIEKHISLGEFVSDSEPIYLISDLSDVWINLAVYPRDIKKVKIGQSVDIKAVGSNIESKGKISYIGNVFDKTTRFVTARVVLPNNKGLWRPGMFVSGDISQTSNEKLLAVKNESIQTINEKQYVFVPETSNIFRAVEVKTGNSDSNFTEILKGLKLGDSYVLNGAFELKSKIVIENQGDPHAGHGH